MDKDNERILFANVIGECIKSLQLDKNINLKELALLSGVSERSLRRIERGQVKAVSCSILIQYNFTQTKRPEVRKNRDFRSFLYKTASGNLAFHPVARTRLTERAKSPTMENRNAVYSKNSRFCHNSGILPPLQKVKCA